MITTQISILWPIPSILFFGSYPQDFPRPFLSDFGLSLGPFHSVRRRYPVLRNFVPGASPPILIPLVLRRLLRTVALFLYLRSGIHPKRGLYRAYPYPGLPLSTHTFSRTWVPILIIDSLCLICLMVGTRLTVKLHLMVA